MLPTVRNLSQLLETKDQSKMTVISNFLGISKIAECTRTRATLINVQVVLVRHFANNLTHKNSLICRWTEPKAAYSE
jgi:hypothetical protein